MRRTLLLASLLLTSGCASTRSTATHADGPFSGPWLMTVRPAFDIGTGDVRTVVFVNPDGAAFEAHSRPGAIRDLVGGRTALLASLFGGEALRGGSLVHLYDGRAVPQGDSVAVTARLVTRGFKASPALIGGIRDGRLQGTLRGQGGALIATIEATPYTGVLPIEDYAALVPQARAVVAERYFDPRELDNEAWQTFWADAARGLANAQDDLEASAQFGLAASGLDVSHFRLMRASTALADTDDAPAPGTGVSFARRPDGVAVLTCLDFTTRQAQPVIDRAFADMAADPPQALVVDLRDCSGGDFSSMRVAAHLVEAPADAGVFISNAWWATNDAPPAPASWSTLPELSAPDLDTFFREVEANGALRARLTPVAPMYGGPVYVLTSERTASAAEPLAHFLKSTGRATLVGETTAGAMLAATRVPFGDGWLLVVPVADYLAADGARLEGAGVAPDVTAEPGEALVRALALPR